MTACHICGAYVADLELHTAWHDRVTALEQVLTTVADTVDLLTEYVDPDGFAPSEPPIVNVAVTGDRL